MAVFVGQSAAAPSRFWRIRNALSPQEWTRALAMVGVVVALHVAGWVTLVAVVAPHRYTFGSENQVFGVGLGVTAYTLGLRHAFDADHLAAIDNTTRKLMADGQRPLSVGFFFSLGHSTIVFVLAFLFSVGLRSIAGDVQNKNSAFHAITGWIGTGVSGGFLYVIAGINLVILASILKVFRGMRRGHYDEEELEHQLNSRGFMNRIFGRLTRSIRKPWHMYPIGVLFGLGFDTATEVALLFLAAGAAGAGLPWYAILVLPILFAAGMSLLDTIDGSFMNFAYGWAFSKPVRKVYYNITITGLSVAIAFIIGSVEIFGIIAQKAGWTGGFWGWIAGLDLNKLGYAIVLLFVVTWAAALAIWKYGRIEEKWSEGMREAQSASAGES